MTDFIKRRELIGDCALYLGDCLTAICDIGHYDAVITDPPYGDNTAYGTHDKEIAGNESPLINALMLQGLARTAGRNLCIMNFTTWWHYPFLRHYVESYTPFKMRHYVIWAKNNMGLGTNFRNAHEAVMVLQKGSPAYFDKGFSDVQFAESLRHDAVTHPHQKPVGLLARMIRHISKPGDTILDPFMGSGSTALACMMTGRKFKGIEIDERFYEMAIGRLTDASRQVEMFVAEPEQPMMQEIML